MPVAELKVNSGTLIQNGEPVAVSPVKDRFGPGLDSVALGGAPFFKTQLQLPCRDVPENDYYVGVPAMADNWNGYVGFGEFLPNWVQIYVNDTRILITSHSEPLRPENAAEPGTK